MTTVFRPYSQSDALRSDRSASDRLRHRQKVRQAIRENVADIVAEESIIGQGRDKIIKVPIRGVKEYRFVYGDNVPGVGAGEGNSQPGQVVGKANGRQQGSGRGGDQPGIDYYETDVTLEELVDIMFEDLQLPDMERKKLREVLADRRSKRKGYRRVGVRVHMDKRRTAIARVRRRVASSKHMPAEEARDRFPFHRDDITFRRLRQEVKPQSNAVVLSIMDTSGSMDTVKKYLARSFFFLLYQFVRARYTNVQVVFIAHHTRAREVSEQEFFHKGESGGTYISSGYLKALEIVQARYHPSLWNIYAFHCSDGDNFPNDNAAALKAAKELCEIANLFGYGEIKPLNSSHYEDSMLQLFKSMQVSNFHSMLIERKEDIWPSFKAFLSRERPVE
ncbi:MAG: YeaH/YhbH family protein [Acidiferrobacterales bacterium]